MSNVFRLGKSHFTAQSLRKIFQDISAERIFNFLSEGNIFGKMCIFRSFWVIFVFKPLFKSVFKHIYIYQF